MNSAREALLSEKRMVCAGLREWAATAPIEEAELRWAAVELVIAAYDGSLADPGWPWVREADALGVFWLDPTPMCRFDGEGGELRLLPVVEALLGGRRVRRPARLLAGLDQAAVELVLAAFTRAARWRWDVAVYAFGGDPLQVLGWLDARRARIAARAEVSRERCAS